MAASASGLTYPVGNAAPLIAREDGSPASRAPRLLDRVRDAVRARHYSRRTEKAYVGWIRRYIVFHGKRHPAEMGAPEITRFLSSLAVQGNVAASTQNQALSALLFLYREVLEQDLPWLDEVVRAKRPVRLPSPGVRSRASSAASAACPVSWPSCCTARASACWSAPASG
jgi:hypothetical protein